MNLISETMRARLLATHGLAARVGRNAAWLFLGRVASNLLLVLFTALVARRMGTVGLGQYFFITSIVFVGNLASTFGTDMLIVREIAARRDFSLLRPALAIQLAISLLFVGAVLLLSHVTSGNREMVIALRLYVFSLIPLAFFTVFSSLLRGIEKMESYTLLNLANAVLLVAAALLIRPASSIVIFASLLLLVHLAVAAIAVLLALRHVPDLFRICLRPVSPMRIVIRLAAPIGVLGFLGALYQRTSVFMLTMMGGAAAVGLLAAALRPVEAVKVAHFSLLGGLFPAMSQAASVRQPTAKREFATVSKTSLGFLLFLSVSVAVIFTAFANLIVPFLFGPGFEAAIRLFMILGWMLIPISLTHYYSLLLLSDRRERPIMLSLAIGLVTLIACMFLLLPRFGLAGAGYAMVSAESVQAVILWMNWRRRHDISELS
jgi:O-antigen/teichoic acid export membrane protein